MLRQNANADLPGRDADGEGEDDRSLIAIGHQNPIAQPATTCQIEFRLIQLNAFLGHGWAGILTRTLLVAFSISFAAANQARTSLSRLARIASSSFCSASITPYRAQAKKSSSLLSVQGFLRPWGSNCAKSLHVRAVGLAISLDASLASRRAFKRSVLARSASRSALYSDIALAPSVARSSFLNCASAHFRSLVSSANVRSH